MNDAFTMNTHSHLKLGKKNRYRLFYFFRLDMENYDGLKRLQTSLLVMCVVCC